ncbi:MAG: hypothetical protein K0U23_07915 [Gammaproteobacteria bacterium]|nr:hypothetical protein [Gammaproteobacteria bacterium]
MKNHVTRLQRLLVALCCIISFGFMANVQAAPKAKKVSFLFVLSAKEGAFQKSGKSNTLTLTDLDPHVLWFTDRPNRKAGFMSIQKFIVDWAKNFKGDPSNAGLVHADMSYTRGGKQAPIAIELMNPRMSGGTLQFDARGLKKERALRVMKLRGVSLFIDNWRNGLVSWDPRGSKSGGWNLWHAK